MVDRIFLRQPDAAVKLDRLFGDITVGVCRMALHRAEIDDRCRFRCSGARLEQGFGHGERDSQVGAAVLERLEQRQIGLVEGAQDVVFVADAGAGALFGVFSDDMATDLI